MRIVIATVQVPFVTGGAEILTQMLKEELKKRGHQVEIVTIPFKWYPNKSLLNCMMMGRMIDLTEADGEKIDRVIAMKFPAIYVKHDHKVLWLMHQHRSAYDLWGKEYGDLHLTPDGKKVRDIIYECDKKYITEAERVFTIAENTSNRLKKYCDIDSVTLYHPPLNYEKLHCEDYKDFIFYPSRISRIKRQRLLVEAARYVRTDVKILLAGSGSRSELSYLENVIKKDHLQERVKLAGFISEEEKIQYYANCLGVYFGAYDEDYGYVTLEALFSEKPVIVHHDAGGPLEFIEDGRNGFVVEAEARKIAEKMDYLYENRDKAVDMGREGKQSLIGKRMDWDYVIEQLLK